MDVVLHSEGDNYRKLKDKLLADEIVNRASITFKEAKQFGKDAGYLCIISGDEERCRRALELGEGKKEAEEQGAEEVEAVKLATEIVGEEKEEILKKIKEEEDKAIEGFGNILG